jgi:hypothetical protein
MPATFEVFGPFSVPFIRMDSGVKWIKQGCPDFWKRAGHAASHSESRGCYVFGLQSGRGITPHYVGKSENSFRKEAFTYQKVIYYNETLAKQTWGRPVMFLVVPKAARGPVNGRAIGNLEKFLIQTAVAKNPDLKNIQGKKEQDWTIVGILRSGPGKPSKAARQFKSTLGI